ncbi:MAG TPA: DUF4912 domain-containing protein [bacterium]|nr:DUF4912 domain-containing protein [bacterium]
MEKKDLLARTKKSLLDLAADKRIKGRSGMTKAQLVKAILEAGSQKAGSGRDEPGGARTGRRAKPQAAPVRERLMVRRSWREQQAVIQHAKYETKVERKPARPPRRVEAATAAPEVPAAYGDDRIVLLVRDPYWVHVYWDISREALLRAKGVLKDEWYDARSVLRVHDITGISFSGSNSNSYYDIPIEGGATNWYINTRIPNRSYCVEIGLLSRSGRFVLLARSNCVTTPRDAPSDVIDDQWMIPDREFDKVYALSGGFKLGASSLELKEMMEKSLSGEMGSGAVGSLGISSPVGKPRVRGFWFRVGTELIVYGATEPDAKVTLQGRPVKLKPDGSFSVRFALPDGKQVIPATAESRDGVDKITITSIVTKKTEE